MSFARERDVLLDTSHAKVQTVWGAILFVIAYHYHETERHDGVGRYGGLVHKNQRNQDNLERKNTTRI